MTRARSHPSDPADRRPSRPTSSSPAPPADVALATWGDVAAEDLERKERIGIGGMGEVYRAWDRRRERWVALKLLKTGDPETLARFLREARAQAACDHPHICRVHGLVVIGDTPAIVMQLVEGATLAETFDQMSLLDRVRAMRDVADALAVAHRHGLVHRDVKPANVLLERLADGRWYAYLADFGAARVRDRTAYTVTGAAIGTPEYMAPEQATSDEDPDGRADVYGVGATLYHLLAGRPPFVGDVITVLTDAIGKDPVPLRTLAPIVPADLAAIVAHAMEKDREHRYPTARALAEDLQRFLEQAPVHAQRPAPWKRLARWARKNRMATAALSLVVVAATAAGGASAWLEHRQAEEVAEAHRYVRDVERIEAELRQAALRPLHDVSADRAAVERRLEELEAALPTLRRRASVVVRYALGRGYLGLGDARRARVHLERAWADSDEPADLALALGRALGESYRVALAEVARSAEPEVRDAKRKELAKELRDPALELLRKGSAATLDVPELLEAQVAFYADDDARALARAEAAERRVPALFEAIRLRGDVHLRRGNDLRDRGDYAGAGGAYALAARAYEDALRVAPSDPESHGGACARGAVTVAANYDQSKLESESFDPIIGVCERALRADPDSSSALRDAADVLGTRARYLAEHGSDPTIAYEQSIAFLERARVASASSGVLRSLGERYMRLGMYQSLRGEDAGSALDHAVQTLELTNEADEPNMYLPYALAARAQWLTSRAEHGDVDREFARAVHIGEGNLARHPAKWRTQNLMGEVYLRWAESERDRGLDPRPRVELALKSYLRVQAMAPEIDYGFVNACESLTLEARYELDQGLDARATAARAIAACVQSRGIDPNYADTHRLLALGHALDAEARLVLGEDPRPALEAGEKAVAEARRIDARSDPALHVVAALAILQARGAMKRGVDPGRFFAAARAAIEEGRRYAARTRWVGESTGELARWEAEHLLRTEGDPLPLLERGLAAVRQLQRDGAAATEGIALEGSLELLAARASRGSARLERARRAADALARAKARAPALAHRLDSLETEARSMLL